MQSLLALARLIDRITAGVGRTVMWLIFASILVSAANAIVRKVMPQLASNAWLELQWYLFGAAFMGAAAYTLQQNEHIAKKLQNKKYSIVCLKILSLLTHLFLFYWLIDYITGMP